MQGWRSSSANEIGKTEVETLLGNVTDKKLLLDESDALNYISIKNRICYYKEYSDVNISTELNESSVLKIFLSQRSIMDSRNVILGYLYNMPSNYHRNDVIFNLKNLSLINISNLEFIEINKQYVWKEPSSCVQKSNIKAYGSEIINMIKSFNISVEQLNIQKDEAYLEKIYLEKQLQMYQEKSVNNKETFKTCAKEYFNLLEQKKEADAQTPINFLSDGHYIKGYNKEGKFIILFDKYENYAVVEYEQCYSKKDTRIARLYDNKENVVTFEYNTIDQLTAIKDVRGRKVSYKYEEGRLKEISFDTGEHVVLYYNSKGWISKVAEDKNCLITTIEDSYSSNLLTISEYSPVSLIGEGTSKLASECDSNGALINKTVVEEHLIDDLMDYVTVSNDEKQEVFKFNRDNNLHEYYELINNKVVKGERYEYANYWEDRTAQDNPRDVVVKLHKDKINTEYSKSFIFVDGDESKTTLNQFNLPASKVEKKTIGINGLEKNVQTSTTTYFYDDNQKLVKEEIVVQADYSNGYTLVKKYNYNLMGDVVRTETYVKGEESLKGKEIEETIYDKTGNAVKSFRYNTLDSSSKLYIETEYSEENKVVAEYDETGENKTEIEYVDGTNIVREQKLPNGSKFVYGHDSDDSVSAISHSTEDGEENSTQRKYNLGRLVKLTSGNNSVEYEYDAKGRTTKVKLNGTDYATYNYTEQNDSLGRLSTRTTELSHYSGHSIARVEDAFGREVSFKSGTDTLREFTYSENKLYKFKNKDKLYRYEYDLFDNLTSVQEIDSYDEDVCSGLNEKTAYNYCGKPITKTINGLVNHNYAYEYRSDASKTLDSITFNNNLKVKPQLDCLGRNKGKEILYSNTKVAEENISYIKVGDHATNMPATIWFGDKTNGSFQVKDSIRYAYDKMGNLEKVYDNGELAVRYAYDALNRLVREDNKYNNKTILFNYDNNGNILKKREYEFSLRNILEIEEKESTDIVYIYEKDKLLSYNGELCQYNSMGNPVIYRNKEVHWDDLKQLTKYDNISFEYDGLGRRTKKGNITFDYDNNGRLIKQSNGLEFFYDNTGVAGFVFNSNTYIYRKDAYGNIIAILDSTGAVIVKYIYDAWGNHSVVDNSGTVITDTTHIGHLNPFRYRSYYYDSETQLFYCNSRYYSPELCRWISPDSIEYLDPESINGLNLYCYCYNNPISYSDPSGNLPQWAEWLIGGAVIVGLGIATVFTGGAAGVILGAAFYGAVTSAVGGALVGGIIGGITGGWEGALDGAASGFMWGAISGAVTGALTSGINIATGSVQIVGSAQKTGSLFHQFASNVQAGKMSLAVGRYSEIHLNRSKGLGIKGFRPDVTGVTKNGLRVVEVVSSSQSYAGQVAKVGRMMGQYSHISNGLTIDALRFITSWFVF